MSGRSICVTSPVITAFDSKPRRVRNIFICSGVVFCASSRMTNASFSVRPRMKAMGATSIRPARQQLVGLLEVHHVVERVVERAQVGVDLLLQLPGRKPEPLARLDRRAGEDDALDLLLHQGADGQRHRQVGLAGAGRADAEHDVVRRGWRRRSASAPAPWGRWAGRGRRPGSCREKTSRRSTPRVGAQRDGRAADVLRADRRARCGPCRRAARPAGAPSRPRRRRRRWSARCRGCAPGRRSRARSA